MYELDEKLLASMRKLGLTKTRLVIACSGGVDSLALTDALARLKADLALELVVAHYEHGIRGEESLADAIFVEKIAGERDLALEVAHGDIPSVAAKRSLSIETAARNLRYEFLESVRQKHAASYILTAHHADDQAETILMHLLRGSGAAGLSGMQPLNPSSHIARPLLAITKSELRAYALARGLTPHEDSTNSELDCTRNRIRLELMPRLCEYNPALVARLNSMGALLREENDFLESLAATHYQASRGEDEHGVYISAETSLAPVILRRVIRLLWAEVTGAKVDLGSEHTESLLELARECHTGASIDLPQGCRAAISYGRLYIRRRGETRQASLADWSFSFAHIECIPEHTGPLEFYFTPRSGEEAVIRYRQPGDFIELKSGRKKLKDLFIDDKIPREERDAIPLLAVGSEILWVIGRRRSIARPAVSIKDKPNIIYITAKRNEE